VRENLTPPRCRPRSQDPTVPRHFASAVVV